MKKKIFIFILFLFVFSDIFSNALDEDCAYLETLLSDVAIDMSLALEEKNLTSKDVINDIKSIYKKTASKKVEFDKKAFASAISESYAKFSNINGHVSVYDVSGDNFYVPFSHQFVYYSDIYFIKENDSYVVYESYKKIKKGMRYTGSTDNLLKTIHDNQILYRFGTFSSNFIKNCLILVENKEYKVPVFGDTGSIKNRKDYDFQKIDDSIYLKIEECNYSDKTKEKQFFEDSAKIIKEFKNTNSIIFDFRNNLGGLPRYLDQFTYALIYDEKTKDNDSKFSEWRLDLYAGEKLINTKSMLDRLRLNGRTSSDLINYRLANLDKKYIEDVEDKQVIVTPWYKEKIYVLINPLTCSAAEDFILQLKRLFGQNVIIIGQNSNGCLDFIDPYKFSLPNSKIQIKLSTTDFRKSKLLTEECWNGDTCGVFPDYWCEPKDIITVLSCLTQNKNLKNFIKL